MRVALLSSEDGWRGSGVSYAKIARGLIERGHLAHLVTAAPRLTSRLVAEGLPVTEIPGRPAGLRAVWALVRTLRRLGIDAIVADTPRDVRLSVHATVFHSARVVYRYNLGYGRTHPHPMERLYLGRIAACVYQSHYVRDDAVSRAPWIARIPGYHVPNGFDTDRFAPRADGPRSFRSRHGIAPDTQVVLTSAKLTANKGHEVAIAALARLRRAGADVVYLICGDGAKEAELRALARAAGLPAIFTGLLDGVEIVDALCSADLLVHPSLREIFPNAVGEAMACGRAVVAADAGGTAELVGRDGLAGVLVPPSDPDALAAAVGELLADPRRRAALGAAARRRIESEFPLSRMVDGYEAALAEVVS
ncbi:MAG: glycosyltransferase family 4 protein [Gemmatimonadales bacterium]